MRSKLRKSFKATNYRSMSDNPFEQTVEMDNDNPWANDDNNDDNDNNDNPWNTELRC